MIKVIKIEYYSFQQPAKTTNGNGTHFYYVDLAEPHEQLPCSGMVVLVKINYMYSDTHNDLFLLTDDDKCYAILSSNKRHLKGPDRLAAAGQVLKMSECVGGYEKHLKKAIEQWAQT